MSGPSIRFEYPVYPDLTLLTVNKRVYACWYYYTLAQKHAEKLGDGSTEAQFGLLEDERWMDPHYEQIARSVALMYGLESPGEFMKESIWDLVELQAVTLKLPRPDPRIKKPLRILLSS